MVVEGDVPDVARTDATVNRTNPPPIAAPMSTPQMPGRSRMLPQIAKEMMVIAMSAHPPALKARMSGRRWSWNSEVSFTAWPDVRASEVFTDPDTTEGPVASRRSAANAR